MSNNSQIPFGPLGNTIAVASNVAAPTGIQAPVHIKFDAQNVGQYRVVNSGTVIVFLGAGKDAATAQTNATAPVALTPSAAIPLLPGAVEIIRFSPDSYFSAISASPVTVYITPGQGL
jgi:hypothetical protein